MNDALLVDYEIYKMLVHLYGHNLKRIDLDCIASFQFMTKRWMMGK